MMRPLFRLLFAAMLLMGLPTVAQAQAQTPPTDPENTLLIDLPKGRVVIEMLPQAAPKHVARIKELVRRKFYDGLVFHRVIDGFMAQGGDPTGTGMGGSGRSLPLEPSAIPHERGIVSMARTQAPNSADSQFFIMLGASPNLDGKYTVWGRVVSGMDAVEALRKGDPGLNGMVDKPDRIIRMRVAADVKDGAAKAP